MKHSPRSNERLVFEGWPLLERRPNDVATAKGGCIMGSLSKFARVWHDDHICSVAWGFYETVGIQPGIQVPHAALHENRRPRPELEHAATMLLSGSSCIAGASIPIHPSREFSGGRLRDHSWSDFGVQERAVIVCLYIPGALLPLEKRELLGVSSSPLFSDTERCQTSPESLSHESLSLSLSLSLKRVALSI